MTKANEPHAFERNPHRRESVCRICGNHQNHEIHQNQTQKPQAETLRQISPDFRMSDDRICFIKGKPFLVRVCEELVGDRWEGFVSMIPCRESATIN